jgi:putative acetyltransferase
VRIAVEDPSAADVHALLEQHLDEMRAVSPPESCHALDLEGLRAESVTFWTARRDGDATLLGCGALLELSADEGEIKSMRTAPAARRAGVAATLLRTIVDEAQRRGYGRLSLETGSQDFFVPARQLYARHGFGACAAFGSYVDDPNSVFMTRTLPLP